MPKKEIMGKTGFRAGVAYDAESGRGIDNIAAMLTREAECGTGIDFCNQELVLKDKTTNVFMSLYFDNGSMFVLNHSTNVVYEVTMEPLES